MQFKSNKERAPRTSLPHGSGFTLALSLAILASAAGIWGAVQGKSRSHSFTETTQRSTIPWETYATRPLPPETKAANEPAANIPDPRATTASPASSPPITTIPPEKAPFTGSFALPFGTKIIKDYSAGEMVKSATLGDWRVHNGVDFAGEPDQPVLAIQSGIIKSVELDPLLGGVVTVDHGNGIFARYCGVAEKSAKKVGETLKKGEALGIIDTVPGEIAENTHLHFEILLNGTPADPLAVMNRDG